MQIADQKNKLFFLLGGLDLEMFTIREILDKQGIAYVDHKLGWSNAFLSSYQEEMRDALENGLSVFGIELQEDIPIPLGYKAIDHHNELEYQPSALEQVMSLLHLPMNRYLQMIAANDKAYIPGMLKLGATAEEIEVIRRADRKAQGVTEEDELLAEKALKERCSKVDDLWVVRALGSRFSPICDRLFPYQRLLIYTDTEWMYYGKGVDEVRKYFKDDYFAGKLFCGGGENGYIGAKYQAYSSEEIQKMVECIQKIR